MVIVVSIQYLVKKEETWKQGENIEKSDVYLYIYMLSYLDNNRVLPVRLRPTDPCADDTPNYRRTGRVGRNRGLDRVRTVRIRSWHRRYSSGILNLRKTEVSEDDKGLHIR